MRSSHTTRRAFLAAIGSAGAVAALRALCPANATSSTTPSRTGPSDRSSGLAVHRHRGVALGAPVAFTVVGSDPAHAREAARAAFAELERVESLMSLYRPESELSRLNAVGYLDHPSSELVEILSAARWVSMASDGCFDVTVQPAMLVHLVAHRAGTPPDPDALARASALVDWRRVSVSRDRIELGPGMAVTLNGIAQGYATDRARAALVRAGVTAAIVDAGELAAIGADERGAPWTFGVQHPEVPGAHLARLATDGRCAATSGQYARTMGASHILDPATGAGARGFASVTVLATAAWLADALSTAIFAAGPDRADAVVQAFPGTDALLVLEGGRTIATPGMQGLIAGGSGRA